MSIFKRKKKEVPGFVQTSQGRSLCSAFGSFSSASPQGRCQRKLYRSLRDAVPVIDAAINKIVRLSGGFKVVCEDKKAQVCIDDFLKNVRVNAVSNGVECFMCSYLDQLLTYGTAVGEIVPDGNGGIAALYNSSLDDVEIENGESPLDIRISSFDCSGVKNEVQYPELILCSAIMPEPGKIYGTSILSGLPFVTDILLKIFSAVGTNWERVGNVRFAVTYKPQDSDRSFTKERAMMIASEWGKAMKSREPKDFIAVGDVSIKAIGADNQIPDCEMPVRCITEQIVSKLSIPPFLLGLNWSSTERMSAQQADILTSELEYYRRVLDFPLRIICSMFLRLSGFDTGFDIVWDNINLQDEVELAKARLYNAQAQSLEKSDKE